MSALATLAHQLAELILVGDVQASGDADNWLRMMPVRLLEIDEQHADYRFPQNMTRPDYIEGRLDA